MLHFVVPPDGLEPSRPDELFSPQADALKGRGYRVSLVSDAVFQEGAALRGIPPGATVVYRGWMVRPTEYQCFEIAVRSVGAVPLNDKKAYELTHHLPNWYPLLQEFTPETVLLDLNADLPAELSRIGWSAFFLKDYVKSLKVDGGSIVRDPKDGARWLREILQYRDELEGGICVRRVEQFIANTECRYFVRQGTPYAPDERHIPPPVIAAAERIASPFFTVDVARDAIGRWRIVELGDGQVSDLVGWTPERFSEIWTHKC